MINRFSRSILGIDIRSDSVAAVLVKSGLKGMTVEQTARIPFGDAADPGENLAVALSQITDEINTSGALCIAALPFTHLSLRAISVPFKEPKKIRQVLPFELEPALPLPVDEQIIDFLFLDRNATADTTDLLVAVIEADELKFYLDRLRQAGLDPESVTINGHATAMATAHLRPEETFMLLDIGLKKTVVYVAVNGNIRFIRSFPLPADTDQKKTLMAGNMRHTLLAYMEQFPESPVPEKIYTTGPGASDTDIISILSETLAIPVAILDFFGEAGFDNPSGNGSENGDELARHMSNPLSLGFCDTMGLKGFNFRKGPFANKKFWMDHKTDFIKTAVFASIVLVMLLANGFISMTRLQHRIDDVTAQLNAVFVATFPDKKPTAIPLEQMRAEIKAQNAGTLFAEDPETQIRTVDLLNELSRSIPVETDVTFTKLVYSAGGVLISGNTDEFNAVNDMKSRLEQSGFFKAVTISSVNKDRSGKRVEFKLKMDLS